MAEEPAPANSGKKKKEKTIPKKEEKLAEFLALMGHKPKARGWNNEDEEDNDFPQEPQASVSGSNAIPVSAKAPEQMSDLEWMRSRMANSVDAAGKVYEQSDDEHDEETTATIPAQETGEPAIEVRL